jgi:glucans biosynthesis protein C
MTQTPERNLYLDYLRTALILLIVLEHASVAYTSAAKLNFFSCKDSIWLIADPNAVQDLLRGIRAFRIPFVIPLLFFISGLFVDAGIRKYGIAGYMRRRLVRIGIPLLIIAFILSPLTHYLPCILTWRKVDPTHFFFNEFFSGRWYIVHGWFLWMLLVFEAITLSCRGLFSQTFAGIGRTVIRIAMEKPSRIYGFLFTCSYVGYAVGIALIHPKFAIHWEVLSGPFFFLERMYLVDFSFFLLGVNLGQSYGTEQFKKIEETMFASPFKWISISCAVLLTTALLPVSETRSFFTLLHDPLLHLNLMTAPALCVLLSMASLSVFRKYVNVRSTFLQSLSKASYTIYIFHFIICVWTEYFLLPFNASAYLKLGISFVTAVLASWALYRLKQSVMARARHRRKKRQLS